MIAFSKFELDNGLKVIVHQDKSTPMVAVNILYDVGSKDEQISKTGFAHLFEHLMFGGSKNIPDFDTPIQLAGGENNAFTNSDITNYYDVLPSDNLETALWLESDRMKQLDFSEQSLDIQRKVVTEEFKETCLNVPYGQTWHYLSEMAYKVHSYQWPTIGKVPAHIEEAMLEDVKAFFYKFYRPNNAILTLAGNISPAEGKSLAMKWFGDIERGEDYKRALLQEPRQKEFRQKIIKEAVPANAIYLAFPMKGRNHPDYYACDLLSDIFANGRSSRFFKTLYKEKQLFSQIDAYISGTFDPGLFIIDGKLMSKTSMETARSSIWEEINLLKDEGVLDEELQKIKNKVESSLIFSEISILNKAISLAYFEVMGDAELINRQIDFYQSVTVDDILRVANDILVESNCNELVYLSSEG